MADRLLIHDLSAECRVGVYDWERAKPQTVWVDLELSIDAARAAATEDVRDAVDYAELISSVRRLAKSRSYVLLETLAEHIARSVLREFKTPRVRVQVRKRSLPEIGYAAVEVERTAGRVRRAARPGFLRRRRGAGARVGR